MATAYKPEITNVGQELLARVIAGSRMEFTRAQLGSGHLGSGEIGPLTALLAPEADAQIASNRTPIGGEVLLNVQYTNKDLADGFDMDELGIFAREVLSDGFGPEVLYCYMTLGGTTERIEAATHGMFTRSWDIPVVVDSALNVTAVVDAGALVTQEQAAELEAGIEEQKVALEDLEERVFAALAEATALTTGIPTAGSGYTLWDYQLQKDSSGVVTFSLYLGRASGVVTAFETIATLPVGFRPAATVILGAGALGEVSGATSGAVIMELSPDGRVVAMDTGSSPVIAVNASFRV